jgi:hypothetical protein
MIRLRSIGIALESYRADRGEYPRSAEVSVETVLLTLQPYATDQLSPEDGWGRSIRYISSGGISVLWSWGRNGEQDVFPGGGGHEGYDVDLILSNGDFWQGHAGACCYDSPITEPLTAVQHARGSAE